MSREQSDQVALANDGVERRTPEEITRDQEQAKIAQWWIDQGHPTMARVFLEMCAESRRKRKAGTLMRAWPGREFSGREDFDRRHEDGRT